MAAANHLLVGEIIKISFFQIVFKSVFQMPDSPHFQNVDWIVRKKNKDFVQEVLDNSLLLQVGPQGASVGLSLLA